MKLKGIVKILLLFFTGRRADYLDSGSLKIQYNRNRYYDYYSGRWLTHDPLGITPNPQKPNEFRPFGQYTDGLNLYEYVASQPLSTLDPEGTSHIGIGLPGLLPPVLLPLPGPPPAEKKCCPRNTCDVWTLGADIVGGHTISIGGGYILGFLYYSTSLRPSGACCFDKKEDYYHKDYDYWGIGGTIGLPITVSHDLTHSVRLETECVKWEDWRGSGSVSGGGAGYIAGLGWVKLYTPLLIVEILTSYDPSDDIAMILDASVYDTYGYWRLPHF